MPIYEYNCRKCGATFEVLLRSKSDTPRSCPKCKAPNPVKALSVFAVGSAAGNHAGHACETCPSAGPSCPSGACPMLRG